MQAEIIDLEDAAEEMGHQEDLQRVHAKIDRLAKHIEQEFTRVEGQKKGRSSIWIAVLSLVVSVIGFPVALLSWLEPHLEKDLKASIHTEVASQLAQPLRDLQKTNDSLNDLSPFIHDVITHQFETLAALPPKTIAERLPAVKNLFKVAEAQKTIVDQNLLSLGGRKLFTASRGDDPEWNAGLAFLNYKSFANAFSSIVPPANAKTGDVVTRFEGRTIKGAVGPKTSVSIQLVPKQDAAVMDLIGVAARFRWPTRSS